MTVADNYAYTDVSMEGTLTDSSGKTVELEIVSMSMLFAVNKLPTAVVNVAMGFSADPNSGAAIMAKAQEQYDSFADRSRVELRLTLKGSQLPKAVFPAGKEWDPQPFTVFDGYVTDIKPVRGDGPALLGITLISVLGGLDAAPISSTQWIAGSSTFLIRPFGYVSCTQPLSSRPAENDLRIDNTVKEDLWEKGLLTFFRRVLAQPEDSMLIEPRRQDGSLVPVSNTAKKMVNDALGMINNDDLVYYAPPKCREFSDSTIKQNYFPAGMASILANVHRNGGSFFTAMCIVGEEMGLDFLPSISGAAFTPTLPAISDTYTYIFPDEIFSLDTSDGVPIYNQTLARVRGVILLSQTAAKSVTNHLSSAAAGTDPSLFGYAIHEATDGQFVAETLPEWVNGTSAGVYRALVRKQMTNVLTSISSEEAREKVAALVDEQSDLSKIAQNDKKSKLDGSMALPDALAHLKLADYMFANRTFTVVGRLRFDIAPGSSVCVGLPGDDAPIYSGRQMFGHVRQVMIGIEANGPGSGRAITQLHITHGRTSKEQEDTHSELVAVEHPLYTQLHVGGSLLPPNNKNGQRLGV